MLRHQKKLQRDEPEWRRDCIKGWWERYGLIIAAIGGTLAISGSCWAFVLRQADPHIDSRFDLKISPVNERLAKQEKKMSEYEDYFKSISEDVKFNKELMLQHLKMGEITRASEAYKVRYFPPGK